MKIKTPLLAFITIITYSLNAQTGNVGIGTNSPDTTLHVVGNIKIEDGNQATSKVLTSDENGVASWQNLVEVDPKVLADSLNIIPRWDGAALIDGMISDNGSTIGIGTSSDADWLIKTGIGDVQFNLPNEGKLELTTYAGEIKIFNKFNEEQYASLTPNSDGPYYQAELQLASASGKLTMKSPKFFEADISTINATGDLEIDATYVGIGTPTPEEKLHIENGKLRIADGTQAEGYVLTSDTAGTASWAPIQELDPKVGNNTTNQIPKWNGSNLSAGTITDVNGLIGLGITNPQRKLHINSTGSANYVTITNGTTGANSEDGLLFGNNNLHGYLYNRESGHLYFGTNDTPRMIIGASGSVGIGTTSPARPLHLNSSNTNCYMSITNSATGGAYNDGLVMGTSSGNAFLTNYEVGSINFGTNGGTKMTIRAGGAVGINTTVPGYWLHVNGNAGKPGGGSWEVASDNRLKKEVNAFHDGMNVISQIDPVTFKYNGKAGIETQEEYVGIIAQEMQRIAPYMVGEFTDEDGKSYLSFDPSALDFIIVNAIKEQQKQIEEKDAIIHSLERRLELLESQIGSILERTE